MNLFLFIFFYKVFFPLSTGFDSAEAKVYVCQVKVVSSQSNVEKFLQCVVCMRSLSNAIIKPSLLKHVYITTRTRTEIRVTFSVLAET